VARRIAIIQGHPDISKVHLCHALADGYAAGAAAAGHDVARINVAQLDFPLLRSAADWNSGPLPPALRDAQTAIGAADHLIILFPLWTGTMPALLKGFFEQVMRPGFAFTSPSGGGPSMPALKGKSARLIVTMGMPALAFRWWYFAHGVNTLKRGMLGMCGIGPVATTYIGAVESKGFDGAGWVRQMRELGGQGA
jgi:putative NADPH-quinone reductase